MAQFHLYGLSVIRPSLLLEVLNLRILLVCRQQTRIEDIGFRQHIFVERSECGAHACISMLQNTMHVEFSKSVNKIHLNERMLFVNGCYKLKKYLAHSQAYACHVAHNMYV